MSLNTMAAVTGVILIAYVGGIAYALLAPRRQRHPEDGMAVGCLMLAAIPGVLVGLLVVAGLVWDIPTLVRWPFYGATTIAGYVLVMLAAQPIIRAIRNRRS
jgi:hypothetical protein